MFDTLEKRTIIKNFFSFFLSHLAQIIKMPNWNEFRFYFQKLITKSYQIQRLHQQYSTTNVSKKKFFSLDFVSFSFCIKGKKSNKNFNQNDEILKGYTFSNLRIDWVVVDLYKYLIQWLPFIDIQIVSYWFHKLKIYEIRLLID